MLVLLWALSRSGRNPDLQTALWRAHHRLCCQQLDANIQTRSVYIIHTLLLYLYNIYIIHNILLYRHHQHAGLFVGVMTRSHRHYPTAYSGCRDRSRFQLEGANIQTRSDQWWCMHIITCSDPQCIYNIYIYIYYPHIIICIYYIYTDTTIMLVCLLVGVMRSCFIYPPAPEVTTVHLWLRGCQHTNPQM